MMNKKILVIDDEPELIHLLSIFLSTAGFEVISAHDGPQALQALERTSPDLIICDMVMPGMDGIATVQAIRQHPRATTLPIIMLSARGQTQDIEQALDAGANDYITKPFRGADVVATVKKYFMGEPVNAAVPAEKVV